MGDSSADDHSSSRRQLRQRDDEPARDRYYYDGAVSDSDGDTDMYHPRRPAAIINAASSPATSSSHSDETIGDIEEACNDPAVSVAVAPAKKHCSLNGQPQELVKPTPAAQAQQQAVVYPAAGGQQQQPADAGNKNNNQIWGFTCKEEGCGMWFPTHQGLGCHAASHKNERLRLQAAAAGGGEGGAMACHGGGVERPAKMHACNKCDRVFKLGVQLGAHKRKHYEGRPIVPKKK